jgi:hypothetical protein
VICELLLSKYYCIYLTKAEMDGTCGVHEIYDECMQHCLRGLK